MARAGPGERGLLYEAADAEGSRPDRLAALDVAEACLGQRGRDAERHELAFAGELGGAHHGAREGVLIEAVSTDRFVIELLDRLAARPAAHDAHVR